MAHEETPRFEFRTWAGPSANLQAALDALAKPLKVESSAETYIISPAAPDCDAKLRAGLFDIKVLLAVRDGFEQWQPRFKAPFPLDARTIKQTLSPALKVPAPDLVREAYSAQQLIDEVMRPQRGLKVIEVAKRRWHYRIDECMAEFAEVRLCGDTVTSVAVEDSDPGKIRRVIALLRLNAARNINYVREMMRLLDLSGFSARD